MPAMNDICVPDLSCAQHHASGGIDAQGLLETASREQSTAAANADRLFSAFVAPVRFSENRAA
jgi:hypothetical protein